MVTLKLMPKNPWELVLLPLYQDRHIKSLFVVNQNDRKARMGPTQRPLEGRQESPEYNL